ncbi:E3 ubiquitin-protein ligase COP1 [Selaginella moellendorffii]|uniref:E3 ubiquitin-protein ligase COP1 n=1 Tax=Selaginella moellendorffii TaxID=88036 RepID=UPI000D1C2971|nr:E3 ubiquitin-protein ligase COP1 [Selaginella moellendorffii]|eukprot:XP_024534499.1 E3 ubiquitin-protein ligase COP1 [Selaginella moellendorffii]
MAVDDGSPEVLWKTSNASSSDGSHAQGLGFERNSVESSPWSSTSKRFNSSSSSNSFSSKSFSSSSSSSSDILCSLDFDPGDEFFVTASVSGYLRVFEFPKVNMSFLRILQPGRHNGLTSVGCEMVPCRKKLSCVSWDKFSKSCVATSDYDGIIKIWDISACQNTVNYDEHERRIWSVDFSPMEPSRLVSGGDDGKVKLWSKELKTSVLTVEVKANICSVTFNPISSNLVGAGSADHCIYYYDLRQTKCPLHLFKGHEKAVSYVKFTPSNEMVSASTDGTLRLWSLESWNTLQVYRGHTNEKNFVGLSVTSDYIACGSETNEVYVYHKGIPKPALSHLFARKDAADDDTRPFVSAVCWRRSDSHTMLAASSQGEIRALMLAS